jgi:5-methyltetrahydrofolate--homocysteine methyltransferase
MGEVSEAELYDAFAAQADALKEGGAQWLAIETMTDAAEMEVAVKAAAATGLPVIASMTYEFKNGEYRTVMGNRPEEAAELAESAGASAVGANCGYGIDAYIDLVPVLKKCTALPVYIKANAGIPELKNGILSYPMDSAAFASYAPKLLEAGVTIIGGCCGTSPEYIAKLKPLVDAANVGR